MPWPRPCERVGRKRRDLTPEEAELWRRVQRTAAPLRKDAPKRGAGAGSRRQGAADPPAPDPAGAPPPAADLSQLSIGGKAARETPAHRTHPPLSERLARQQIRMDSKAYGRMRRGKLDVEGRIDLHGMKLAEAHPRLIAFVTSSHAAGRRLVLVITGKGRDADGGDPVPMRRGILRRQVPHWLAAPPLRGLVLQVSEAHRRHGGSGAFYVYLRRK